jgi:hypothetical protein
MRRAYRPLAVVFWGLVGAVLLAGCGGPKTAKVEGKLTWKGQALKVSRDTYVTISFGPAVEKPKQTYQAKFDPEEGTYHVTIPTGKYRVGVTVRKPDGETIISPAERRETYDIQDNKQIELKLD